VLRQKWGSVVCPGCGTLVGVQDERCLTCNRWNPGMWGFAPVLTRLGRDMGFVPFVMASCAALYAATLLTSPQITGGGIFSFLSPSLTSLFAFGASGSRPVLGYGRWWTVLTASWLHASLIHIVMNMMSIRNVAPLVAEFYGASRMIIIYVLSGVAGFTLSTLGGAYLGGLPILGYLMGGGGFTVGASASITGLIGAIYFYGHRTGSGAITEQARFWVISFLIMGFLIHGIDNWAHVGGLVGGYFCAKILDPLTRERLDHFLIAIGLLALSAIAVIVSFTTALSVLR
jgi:rhomboid protease GluP